MGLFHIICLFPFFVSEISAHSEFSIDLSQDHVFFDDPLIIKILITTTDEIIDPVVEIRLSHNFNHVNGDVICTTCQDDNSICFMEQNFCNGSDYLAMGPEIFFDNRMIADTKIIPLVENVSSWDSGTMFKSDIRLHGVFAADIDQSSHFVIGRLKYRKMVYNGDDVNETISDVEYISGKYLSIFPISVNILLDGKPPDHKNDTKSLFHCIEVVTEIDRRVGDAVIKFPVPQELTITQAGYTLGDQSDRLVELSTQDNELSILLTQFTFLDSADQWCVKNRCHLKLFAVVVTAEKYANMSLKKEMSIKGTVLYGNNFQSKMDSDTLLLILMEESNSSVGMYPDEDGMGDHIGMNHGNMTGNMPQAGTGNMTHNTHEDMEEYLDHDLHEMMEGHMDHNETMMHNSSDVIAVNEALNPASCREDWWSLERQNNDHCYHFPSQKLSFSKAEKHCSDLGAHLPSFHSPYGFLTLSTFWKNHVSAAEIWLGLTKIGYEKDWEWTDGSPYDFKNWCNVEEPPDWSNCTVISGVLDDNYCWLNRGCGQEFYFFCQEPAKPKALWWL